MAVDAVPSHQRCVPGSHNIPQAEFPPAVNTPSSIDAAAATAQIIESFNEALAAKDFAALAALFVDGQDTYWRDHLALTWVFRTVEGRSAILEFLNHAAGSKDGFRLKKIAADTASAFKSPQAAPIDPRGEIPGIRSHLTLETAHGTGTGLLKLVHQEDGWKIFTLYTRLEELRGHEQGAFFHRPQGVQHGGQPGRKNWAERREAEAKYEDGDGPAVLIVGMSLKHLPPLPLVRQLKPPPPRCRSSWPHRCSPSQSHRHTLPHHRPQPSHRRQLAQSLPPPRTARSRLG